MGVDLVRFGLSFFKIFYFCFAIIVAAEPSLCFCLDGLESSDSQYSLDQIFLNVSNQLGLPNFSGLDTVKTQTFSYLSRPGLRETLAQEFDREIKRVGVEYIKDLFRQILDREIKFREEYFVFYHGQSRSFKILYDISQALFETIYKKSLVDFIFMRFPEADLTKFNSVQDFLKKYIENGKIHRCDFDEIPKIRKKLLALNPCLFGNSRYLGECSFYYFIASTNASYVDFGRLIYKMFEEFGLHDFYQKYEVEINEMLELLSAYEDGQTGFLVQIFIPKKLVNSVVYRCRPWGLLYYQNDPQSHTADEDLNAYKCGVSDDFKLDYEFDSVQFRALMNQDMLDPAKGVRYFCYCKETENVKKYVNLYQKLVRNLSSFIKSKKINKNMFCWSSTESS